MRISYAIPFGDFRSLQKPFTLRPGRNVGFIAAMGVCALIVALGCFLGGYGGAAMGCFGVLSTVAAWFYEKASISGARRKYETNLLVAYQGIHCRNQRTLDADENGFTTTCKCGTVARPWSELARVSETDKLLLLGARKGTEAIPKSAFASEGELTEFRNLLLDKLNLGCPPLASRLEFAYDRADFRSAHWLHAWRVGGRRKLFLSGVRIWGIAVIIFFVLTNMRGGGVSEGTARLVAIGGAILISVVPALARRRQKAFPSVRIYYGTDGFLVEEFASRLRYTWDKFIGYLENKRIFLIYINQRQYIIIPKRALRDRTSSFSDLLREHLTMYDPQNPVSLAQLQVRSGANGSPSVLAERRDS